MTRKFKAKPTVLQYYHKYSILLDKEHLILLVLFIFVAKLKRNHCEMVQVKPKEIYY